VRNTEQVAATAAELRRCIVFENIQRQAGQRVADELRHRAFMERLRIDAYRVKKEADEGIGHGENGFPVLQATENGFSPQQYSAARGHCQEQR